MTPRAARPVRASQCAAGDREARLARVLSCMADVEGMAASYRVEVRTNIKITGMPGHRPGDCPAAAPAATPAATPADGPGCRWQEAVWRHVCPPACRRGQPRRGRPGPDRVQRGDQGLV